MLVNVTLMADVIIQGDTTVKTLITVFMRIHRRETYKVWTLETSHFVSYLYVQGLLGIFSGNFANLDQRPRKINIDNIKQLK